MSYEDETTNTSSNPHINDFLAARLSRRQTLKGGVGLTTSVVNLWLIWAAHLLMTAPTTTWLAWGVGAFVLGRPFLTSAFGHPHVPLLGELPLATAAIFDLGVYLTVVGSTLLTVSVLGNASRETSPPAAAAQASGAAS